MFEKGTYIEGRYEILDQIGTGGMSLVYKALDHTLNRNVAIKVLKSEFAQDPQFLAKFQVEAQAAAGLNHPNIVNIYEGHYLKDLYRKEGTPLLERIRIHSDSGGKGYRGCTSSPGGSQGY